MKKIFRLFLLLGVSVLALLALAPSTYAADYEVSCTGSSGSPTAITEATYSSSDNLTLTDGGDGYCALDAALSVNNLTINSGVVLTHADEDTTGVTITAAGDMTVTGDINVDEKGCGGGTGAADNAEGPDLPGTACTAKKGGYGDYQQTGASYGGVGGTANYSDFQSAVYGDQTDPAYLGSGGGTTGYSNIGGNGGGLVILTVTGILDIDGVITADGGDGTGLSLNGGGGGSGGGIKITAGTLSGAGSISADGGAGGDGSSRDAGGGGGGRAYISYTTLGDFTLTSVTATGGTTGGQDGATAGENGTTYLLESDANNLTVTSGVDITGNISMNTITISNGAYWRCNGASGDVTVEPTSGNLNFDSGTIECDENLDSLSIVSPADIGMEGTTVDYTGSITAANFTAASGTIALGTLTWTDTNSTTITVSASTITTSGTSTVTLSSGATVLDFDPDNAITFTNFTVNGTGGGTATAGSTLSIDDAVAVSLVNSDFFINSSLISLSSLTIDGDSKIDTDDLGCKGATTDSNNAYGPNLTGEDTGKCGLRKSGFGTNARGGAAHGGAGGAGTGAASATYDTNTAPVFIGSGGGSGGYNADGGLGGGKIRIDTTGTFTLNGSLLADGQVGEDSGNGAGGGGSGGAIYITTNTIAGSGTISADGGVGADGALQDSAGAGGGMIAVYYTTDSSTFLSGVTTSASTAGGAGGGTGNAGSDGQVYKLQYTVPDTPSISAPTDGVYNISANPVLTSSAFNDNGSGHDSTDWKVTTDTAGDTVVWSKSDDASNLETITVNSSNGTFAGALAGETALADFTTYYVFVRHTNAPGDSSWSATGHAFTTQYTGSTTTYTSDFTATGDYTYDNSVVDVDVVDSMGSLKDLGGSYTASEILEGWARRKPITITGNGTALTNFPIRINVSYDSDMQADFDDLRFTTSDGSTLLDYYLESKTDSTSAMVWVEVDSIAASGSTTIYMYYKNASASSASAGSDVFPFFDDFETWNGWSDWSSGTVLQSSDEAYEGSNSLIKDNNDDPHGGIKDLGSTFDTSSTDYIFEFFVRRNTGYSGGAADRLGIEDGDGDGYGLRFSHSTLVLDSERRSGGSSAANSDDVTGAASTLDSWKIGQLIITSTTVQSIILNSDYTTNTTGATWTESTVSSFTRMAVHGGNEFYVDAARVRPYQSSDPSTSIGAEEATTDLYAAVDVYPSSPPVYTKLLTFAETLSGSNAGTVAYQFSHNGTDWYYHNGTSWTAVTDDSAHNNTSTEMNNYLSAYVTDVNTGNLYIKAFLLSDGTEKVELDKMIITYDGGAPTGLASLAVGSTTATTVDLTWTAASDDAFDHYEIWYGTSQSEVQNRNGAAVEWDNDDDANLTTVGTATTTITGLTAGLTYYVKIWAVDGFVQEATIDDISFNTNQAPTVASLSAVVATDRTGEVTVSFVMDDADDDDTLEALVEYSTDGGSGWSKATISETAEDTTATYGTPDVENDDTYQVGNASVGYITSSSGANTITVIWDSMTDASSSDESDVQIRVTPYDSIAAGTPVATSNFTLDNVVPAALANFAVGSMTATTAPLTWTPATDTNFDHYEIWYSTTQSNAQNRAGDAVEWDDSDDANLTTATTNSTTITGLTEDLVYYVKIWAIDSYGNLTTLSDTTADTNTAPISLASFTSSATTSSSITYTWTAASDPNFDHYEIWYGETQSDVENRTGTATEWDDSDDTDLGTASTATTTITGLSENTTYYAKIWAIDANANESTLSTATANNNGRPTLANLTGTQSTSGDGQVTVSFTMDDLDDDDTLQGKVEYSLDGSTWSKATLSETAGDITSTYGTLSVENDNTYQVGNSAGYVISSSGANTITVIWDSATDEATANTSTAQVRVTPYDGTEAGAVLTSSANILVDNVAPVGMDDLAKSSGTATQMVLTWTAASTETSFDHYEIWYGTTQADVESRSGTATEWDGDDDATLATLSTATTTITGLTEGTTYYFRLHAIDSTGNDTNATTLTAATNNLPTVTSVTPTAATDGTGNVTLSILMNDADTEDVELLIEYTLDGTTWNKATLSEETTDITAVNGIAPTVENDNTRQVGATGSAIDTSGGENTITVIWASVTDAATTDAATIQVRATPYDGNENGTAVASDAFTLDNVVPVWSTLLTLTAIGQDGLTLTWTAATDTNFDHYEVWYGTDASGVTSRDETLATEWDNDDDADLATAATTTTDLMFTLEAGRTYTVGIWAVDAYGNESGPVKSSRREGDSNIVYDESTGTVTTFGGGGSGGSTALNASSGVDNDESNGGDDATEAVVEVEEVVVEESIEESTEEVVEEVVEETVEEIVEEVIEEVTEEEITEEVEEVVEEETTETEETEGRGNVIISYGSTTLNEVVEVVEEIIPSTLSWSATSLKDFGSLDVVQTVYNTSSYLNILIFDFFFAPADTISRIQGLQLTLHMFVEGLFEEGFNMMSDISFGDVSELEDYTAYLLEGERLGIVSGHPDGTFRPNADMTRAEALKLFVHASGTRIILDPSKGLLDQFDLSENPFSDLDLESWYASYVLYAYHKGYIQGYPDGTFRGDQAITRAEFSSMAVRILEDS